MSDKTKQFIEKISEEIAEEIIAVVEQEFLIQEDDFVIDADVIPEIDEIIKDHMLLRMEGMLDKLEEARELLSNIEEAPFEDEDEVDLTIQEVLDIIDGVVTRLKK